MLYTLLPQLCVLLSSFCKLSYFHHFSMNRFLLPLFPFLSHHIFLFYPVIPHSFFIFFLWVSFLFRSPSPLYVALLFTPLFLVSSFSMLNFYLALYLSHSPFVLYSFSCVLFTSHFPLYLYPISQLLQRSPFKSFLVPVISLSPTESCRSFPISIPLLQLSPFHFRSFPFSV